MSSTVWIVTGSWESFLKLFSLQLLAAIVVYLSPPSKHTHKYAHPFVKEERRMSKGEEETLVEAALRVLSTADPFEKARLGDEVANRWLQGQISRSYDPSIDLSVPDRPARLSSVKLVSSSLMPKLGKAGSLQSRQALVHSLVHTESWAIDLSWVTLFFLFTTFAIALTFFRKYTKLMLDILYATWYIIL